MQPAEVIIPSPTVCFDSGWRSIEDIVAIAERAAAASLSDGAGVSRRDCPRRRFSRPPCSPKTASIYGVTTGFGDSCTVAVAPELVAELPRHLYTFHGCGLGAHFTPSETRAVIATRLTSLCKGFSGVSVGLLEQLVQLAQPRYCAGDPVRRFGGRQRRSDAAVLSRRGACAAKAKCCAAARSCRRPRR